LVGISGSTGLQPANINDFKRQEPSPKTYWPTEYYQQITSAFNTPRPDGRLHKGVDRRARLGAKVFAAPDGWVKESGRKGDLGNYILIEHPDGSQTLYGHLSQCEVEAGQYVRGGQEIGKARGTGKKDNQYVPHLHFARYVNGSATDPTKYVLSSIQRTDDLDNAPRYA